ncbi:unnamed protein product [Lampetra planeri]
MTCAVRRSTTICTETLNRADALSTESARAQVEPCPEPGARSPGGTCLLPCQLELRFARQQQQQRPPTVTGGKALLGARRVTGGGAEAINSLRSRTSTSQAVAETPSHVQALGCGGSAHEPPSHHGHPQKRGLIAVYPRIPSTSHNAPAG